MVAVEIKKLEEYGFCKLSGMNPRSNYCAVIPITLANEIEVQNLMSKLEDFVSFIIYLPNKHTVAGLPPDATIGTFFRRFILLLDYFKNVNKVIIIRPIENYKLVKNKNLEIINEIYNLLINFAETSDRAIEDVNLFKKQISLKKIVKKGRINRYRCKNFDTEKKIKEILGRIEEIILGYHYEHLKNCLAEVAGVFRLEKPYNDQLNFNVHPKDDSIRRRVRSKGLDVYRLEDTNIKNLYESLEYLLYEHGIICKDASGFYRVQMPFKTRCKLIYKDGYTGEVRNQSKLEEVIKLLEELGIEITPFEETRFFKNIEISFKHYINYVCDSIMNGRFGLTNVLPLVGETSKELDINRVQLGWIYSHVYLRKINDELIDASILNDLRSVDLHDGFPYNLYYCIELAENLINNVNKCLSMIEANKKIILRGIYLDILSLHAYIDNLPEKRR